MPPAPISQIGRRFTGSIRFERLPHMSDLPWLAMLGGLFALTLAFVRLCDAA